jgi:hypothetical protein
MSNHIHVIFTPLRRDDQAYHFARIWQKRLRQSDRLLYSVPTRPRRQG